MNRTWHVLNYIKQEGSYYIIDPNSYIEKYKEHCPIEDGVFTTYAKCKMITGGVLKTTNLYDFISFYEKFVSLGNLKYLFIKIEDYKLPYFCIEHVLNGFKIYLNPEATIKVLNSYDKNIYELSYSKIIDSNLIPIKESPRENIWKTLMKMKSISQNENK